MSIGKRTSSSTKTRAPLASKPKAPRSKKRIAKAAVALPARKLSKASFKTKVLKVFQKIFNQALNEKGVPALHYGRQKWVAERYHVSQSAARKWATGECLPDVDNMILIADDLGYSIDQMLGRKTVLGTKRTVTVPLRSMTSTQDKTGKKDNLGSIAFEEGTIDTALRMSFNGVNMVMVSTDSMADTINVNDVVFVDTEVSKLEDHRIYMFEANDRVLIRRVFINLDGSLDLKCDNNKYPEIKISQSEIQIGERKSKGRSQPPLLLVGEISRTIKRITEKSEA